MNRSIRFRCGTWAVLVSLLGCLACGNDAGFVYPDPQWQVEPPGIHNLDPDLLEAAASYAEENASNCLVVTRDGVIVGEWYWNGWDASTEQNVFSVSKSVTSALVGIAQDRGQLDIQERASAFITEWVGTDSEDVTIRNLISNDSGRYWDLITDYVRMYALARDKTAFSIELGQQHEPGSHWEYNNCAIQTLERVFGEATGMDLAEYARARLFEPLGMASSYGHDPAGNTLTFSDVSASCRDLARLGYLYLRAGRWSQGRQIVSRSWVTESTQPSTDLNSAYGFMWWLNREGHWVTGSVPMRIEGKGRIMPGLPEEVFRASGAFDQIIFVDPEADIVFTRLGNVTSFEQLISSDLAADLARLIHAAVLD